MRARERSCYGGGLSEWRENDHVTRGGKFNGRSMVMIQKCRQFNESESMVMLQRWSL